MRVSGGVAGLSLGGTLDTVSLPAELATRTQTALSTRRLTRAGDSDAAEYPDQRQWTVTTDGRRFELVESQLDEQQLEVLDALLAEVVRRRKE